ncbi:MAG: CaiB/BaiF CoA-transferase family protein [Immundisolibacterales bacterium]|nr:CaiB/BaiF CoA-transferase family protein [Immundisolibacterales bacterium]
MMGASRPLEGIRVVELGQLIAGPFAGSVLAYFGAEVVKVEPPGGGDAIRGWRVLRDGTSYFWRMLGRNKKSVTLSLRTEEGRALARRLIEGADVVIENFRSGAMEAWGLGPEKFRECNPGLVYARVSGYGQTGPYSARPGYASVCEGIGGLRYLNGFPGEAPVRPNLSLGDTLAGLHAALGILLALVERGKSSRGQLVDVAIYESVFNMLESVVPEYDGEGLVREPSGTTLTGIVPTNTYPCRDGRHVIIGGNGDAIYRRLMRAADRPDLADDPRLAHNAGRVEHEKLIDGALAEWTGSLDLDDVLARLAEADVPAGPIYSVADIMEDPHYRAREMFHRVEIDGEPLVLPAMSPRLDATPGGTEWPGPELGSHNREILEERLGLGKAELEALRAKGVL